MTTTNAMQCVCCDEPDVIDRHNSSSTLCCRYCGSWTLEIRRPDFELSIPLGGLHLKRGDALDLRPLTELRMATQLVERLVTDQWPSPATIVDFGIESSAHLGALQFAVRSGITAYDLDRVMGSGPAVTQLVRGIPGQPYGNVEFVTAYDTLLDFGGI